jgi:SAM-dependent methyltransferase
MTVFGNYARYYDLVYRNKDYTGEAKYVHGLIKQFLPNAKSILELGCGTGRHAELLYVHGYDVCGIDYSSEMLKLAMRRTKDRQDNQIQELTFLQEDIRNFQLNRHFDVVIALFHVISYQTGSDDLRRVFEMVKRHLVPGGVFIFDCWYGPAVLTDRPVVRELRIEDEKIEVTRIAEPVMHPNENIVDVNYRILIRDKKTGKVEEVKEIHRMRYLFKPEVEFMLSDIGMRIIACEEWVTGRVPGFDTWGVCFVGRA